MAILAAADGWTEGYHALAPMLDPLHVVITIDEAYSVQAPKGSWSVRLPDASSDNEDAIAEALKLVRLEEGTNDNILDYIASQFTPQEIDIETALILAASD